MKNKKHEVTCLKLSKTFLGRQLRVVFSFLIDGLVVDGGPAMAKRKLQKYYQTNQVDQAVFTHCHEDHAGNIDLFNSLGILPYVHSLAIPYLASPPTIPLYRRVVWDSPAAGAAQAIGSIIETDRYKFKVLATPGHAPDHICLYEEKQGWLFTGDLYIGERAIYLYSEEHLPTVRKSLEFLSTLDFSTIFCSHLGAVEKGPETIKRKLSYYDNLQEKAHRLKEMGLSTAEITKRLLGKEDYMYMISRGEFSKGGLMKALLS
ncbi:MAG: MBL fold metallo-hydrolase [Bacillota bacterium]|nr:MBL fold metallo-hydrolase [Bacillota bacterium]